ncbi:hypothetical protein MLD38_031669 [Melastoma candidum]|uniref:Uncharacterized protein n=1 Tax=Melastoma candidum TaxID=119954 RepID=A0ACB9MV34_9MYRT|nr:hypothetical protein MLD38_031669 [Melastoma candidum]
MLLLVGSPPSVPLPLMKTTFFFFKTGSLYLSLQSLQLASSCLDKSSEILSRINPCKVADSTECKLFLDVNLARARATWECKDVVLAVLLLSGGSKGMLLGSAEHHQALANQYMSFGKSLLGNSEGDAGRSGILKEALKLINGALELCEKGLKHHGLRSTRLICMISKEKEKYRHPSLPVLAMKAWLGLGKHSEAEKVVGTAGAETAKGVFLGLLGRCHVGAGAAVRVVARVADDVRESWKTKGEGGSVAGFRGQSHSLFVGD